MTAPTRDHVLAAAARLFGAHGFRGTTTRRIAEEAGVNEVTIFRHFGSKTALILEAIRTHGASFPTAPLPDVPVDPVRELGEWCANVSRHVRAARSMIRKSMGEFEEHPEVPKCMSIAASSVYGRVRAYFSALEREGFIPRSADVTAATAMLMSAVFHDAIGRDVLPHVYPQPASSAPAAYARLCLRALGCEQAAERTARRRAS